MDRLTTDMHDFLRLLKAHQVEFLICGGHAVAFHGHPRLTKDIDIFVRPTPDNARRLFVALTEFGFGQAGIPEHVFAIEGTAVSLGMQPNQIDLLTSVGGKNCNDIDWQGRPGVLDGIAVRFLALDDLLAAKRAAGRLKDLADLEELEAMHPDHRSAR